MALNFDLNSLFEPALLSDEPWWSYILGGAGWTVALMLTSFALALLLGIIVGTLRTSQNKFLSTICEVWIETFRNIPLIVQIFVWFFVVPEFIPWYKDWMNTVDPVYSQFLTAFICMGFFTSSRVAEQVRAGIASVPKGLPNAAKALGFTPIQTYAYVILPLAMRLIVPPLTSEAMNLVKNTAVALTIYIVIALIVNNVMRVVEKKSAVPGLILAK